MRGEEVSPKDPTRRTQLAAERTWLAWWRTGLAAAAGAIATGRVLPELLPGAGWPYAVLGTAYGVLAVALMLAAAKRQTLVREALRHGGFAELSDTWVHAFTAAGVVLSVFTVILILVG